MTSPKIQGFVMKQLFVVLLILCLAVPASGLDKQGQIKVKVDIKGDAELLDRVDSFFNRELRSLGDVVITDEDPNFNIYITAMEMEGCDGEGLGIITVSYIVFSRLAPQIYAWVEEKGGRNIAKADWEKEWGSVGGLERYGEFIISPDDLRGVFEELVIQLDTKVFVKFRQ